MQQPPQPVKTMGPLKFFAILGVGFGALCLVAYLLGSIVRPDTAPSEQAIAEPAVDLRLAPENWVTVGPKPTATPRPTATPKPTATPLPGVGDAIILDGVTLKVTRAEDAGQTFSTNERETPVTTSGKFVWLTVEVTNTGKEPIALHAPNLTDSAGREFTTHEDSVWYMPHDELCAFDTLNPGLTKTCSYLFELPADVTGIAAVLKTSLFSDGVRVSLLP